MANPGDFVTILERHVTGGPEKVVQNCTNSTVAIVSLGGRMGPIRKEAS